MTRRKPSRLTTGRLQLLRLFSTLLPIALTDPDGPWPILSERYGLILSIITLDWSILAPSARGELVL